MKIRDRSRNIAPDVSVLTPLFVLFVTSLNGPSLGSALHRSLGMFTQGWTAVIFWAQIIILDGLLYGYFLPVFKLHIRCLHSCKEPETSVNAAMRKLNHARFFVIVSSVAVFMAGRFFLSFIDAWMPIESATGNPLFQLEAAISGFFVGVILTLQFDDRLYQARQTIQHMVSTEQASYSSLYSKLTLILLAMALYMTLQAFSFAGSAVSLSQLGQFRPQSAHEGFMTAPELLNQAKRFVGLKDLLGVFFFKALALGGFIVQLLYQLKRLIARPIATIQDRLEVLNSSDPAAGSSGDYRTTLERYCIRCG